MAPTESVARISAAAITAWTREEMIRRPLVSTRSMSCPAGDENRTIGPQSATKRPETAQPEPESSETSAASGIRARKSPPADRPDGSDEEPGVSVAPTCGHRTYSVFSPKNVAIGFPLKFSIGS